MIVEAAPAPSIVTETATTTRYMMTTAMMTYYAYADSSLLTDATAAGAGSKLCRFYDDDNSWSFRLTAQSVALDRTLAEYGPEADLARNLLRRAVVAVADGIWRESGSDSRKGEPFEASAAGLAFYDEILKLSPRDDRQRSLQARAIDAAQDLAKTRLLLFAEAGMTIPMPFLVVLVSWLAIIFASFSLFADNNATTIGALGIFGLSASASIFLILELSQPFSGIMMIPSEQLRNALAPLGS